VLQLQPRQPLQLVLGQLLQFQLTFKVNAVDVLAMSGQVLQHTFRLLLVTHHSADAAGCDCSHLAEPAVGTGCAEDAVRVVSTAAQHCH
jgi:hypothetical protein